MLRSEGTFTSSDKSSEIAYTVCAPEKQPKAVLQVIHGMCEYADRYAHFAEYLAENGIVFCGADNLGHGRSAKTDEDLGYFGDDGAEYLVEDVRQLYLTMRRKYRRLPYIMLGHSMGSFILRKYITKYGDTEDSTGTRLDGAILSGTAGFDTPVKAGLFVANLTAKLRGEMYRSKFLRSMMFKGYNKRYPNDGEFGWLTRDSEERTRYSSDPKCNFLFTAAGYRDMLTILRDISDEEWAGKVPLSLPVYVIAGSEDPVGSYGAGPHDVADRLIDAEVNEVSVKIYDGYRHELFFEVGRENVYADVVSFVDEVIEGVHEARMAQAFNGFHVPLTTMGDYDTPAK